MLLRKLLRRLQQHRVSRTCERSAAQSIELLERAASRVERGHCQGAFARDAASESVASTSSRAVAWDIIGALRVEGARAGYYDVTHSIACREIMRYARSQGFASMEDWQDAPGRTGAQVAAGLRECASRIKREQGAQDV